VEDQRAALQLNRWKSLRFKITKPDQSTFEVEAKYSDADTVVMTTARDQPFEAGWLYQAQEYEAGGVWKFQTTEPTTAEKAAGIRWQKIAADQYMVEPLGVDARAPGPTFRKTMPLNEPNKVLAYGRLQHQDYVTMSHFNELRDVLAKLKHVNLGAAWIEMMSRTGGDSFTCAGCSAEQPGPNDPYFTQSFVWGLVTNGGTYNCDPAIFTQIGADAAWSAATPAGSSGRPYVFSVQWMINPMPCRVGVCADIEIVASCYKTTNWGKGQTTKQTLIPGAVDFYNFAVKASTDPGELETETSTIESVRNCIIDWNPSAEYGDVDYVDVTRGDFLPNGYTYFHRWRKWATAAVNQLATVTTTTTCGSNTTPPAAGTMGMVTGAENLMAQWQVAGETAIARYDVGPDRMVYIDE
jgi:hypothetical protein